MGIRGKFAKGIAGTAVFCLVLAMAAGMNLLPVFSGGEAWAAGELQAAPMNPDFVKFMAAKANPGVAAAQTATIADGHSLGFIPPTVKMPAPPAAGLSALAPTALPSKFDLRTSTPNGLTAVRDQAQCGSCWTFGTMASFESYLKYKMKLTTDYSEEDLNEYNGFDYGVCMGGNYNMSTAYLARWSGPVTEMNVPYPYWISEATAAPVGIPEPTAETPGVSPNYLVQNVYWLPQSARPLAASDISAVKAAVQASGAVGISYYMDNAYYNDTKHSFYCNAPTSANHAVAIVGWDDSYSSTNFNYAPPGNGAFIVRNSWGTGWGEAGYFYMSYYDQSLVLGAQFNDAEPRTKYSRVYEYDPLGYVGSVGFGTTTGWISNIFMASANASNIKGVSTYTLVPNSTYKIMIYSNVTPENPKSGSLVLTKTGTISKPGYHTIPFAAVAVAPNKPFSVVMKLTTPGWNFPIPGEYKSPGYTSAASACPGQSFISSDGTTWYEAYFLDWGGDFNVNLKAFAVK